MCPAGPEITLRELSHRLEQQHVPVLTTPTGQYILAAHRETVTTIVAAINDDLRQMHAGRSLRDGEVLHVTLRPRRHALRPDADTEDAALFLPDNLTRDQQEILTTLRALAGLVADAIRQEATLTDADGLPAIRATLTFWRDLLLLHTRRLLPDLISPAGDQEAHAFAERLVREVYREDQDAIAHHGCDPLTCTHEAHAHG
jgi:hypothetical protein